LYGQYQLKPDGFFKEGQKLINKIDGELLNQISNENTLAIDQFYAKDL
jgi:hypothetical protein